MAETLWGTVCQRSCEEHAVWQRNCGEQHDRQVGGEVVEYVTAEMLWGASSVYLSVKDEKRSAMKTERINRIRKVQKNDLKECREKDG